MKIFDICQDKEAVMLASAASGDAGAFAKAYDLLADAIYRFILLKTSNKEDAEDLTSKTFLKTWDYVSKQKGKGAHFKALLYTTARNLVIDYYRTRRSNISLENAMEIQAECTIEKEIAVKYDLEKAYSILGKIKKEYREVITMRFVDELSTDEIAEILGKDNGNIRVILHRAIKKIKEIENDKRV